MKKIFSISALVVVLALVLTGCGKYPQAEIDAAKAAVDSAKMVEVDRYLPDQFAAIQDSLNSAIQKAEEAKSKLFKNYGEAKQKLQAVIELAKQARTNVEAKKNEVKQEVENALSEIDQLINEDKDLLKKAPKGKEGKAALEQMQAELTAVENTVAEAKGLYDKGDFIGAKEKLMPAKEKAASINSELKAAIEKVKGKK